MVAGSFAASATDWAELYAPPRGLAATVGGTMSPAPTANAAVSLIEPADAWTAWEPGAEEGTEKVAEKLPVFVLVTVGGLVATAAPSKVMDTTELARK
jgi:hypothetical protein